MLAILGRALCTMYYITKQKPNAKPNKNVSNDNYELTTKETSNMRPLHTVIATEKKRELISVKTNQQKYIKYDIM